MVGDGPRYLVEGEVQTLHHCGGKMLLFLRATEHEGVTAIDFSHWRQITWHLVLCDCTNKPVSGVWVEPGQWSRLSHSQWII